MLIWIIVGILEIEYLILLSRLERMEEWIRSLNGRKEHGE